MGTMTTVLAISLTLTAGAAQGASDRAEDSMRCDGAIISPGASVLTVMARCGAPDHRSSRPILVESMTRLSRAGAPGTSVSEWLRAEVETWVYAGEPGELMRVIEVHDGTVQSIAATRRRQTGEPPCTRESLPAGTVAGEIAVRCGAPDHISRSVREREKRVAERVTRRELETSEVWTYDPGPGRFLRRLHFINGHLIEVEQGERSSSK